LFDVPDAYSNYRLVEFSKVLRNERSAVELRAEFTVGDEVGYWEAVLDEESAVLLNWEMGSRKPSANFQVQHAEMEYDFSSGHNGPMIQRYTSWTAHGKDKSVYNKQTQEVLELDTRPPSKNLFYPASIGIDIDYARNYSWILYALSGLAVLALGIWVRNVRNRSSV
jgi:hypothetical protein